METNFDEERTRAAGRYSCRQEIIRKREYRGIALGAAIAVGSFFIDGGDTRRDNLAHAYEENRTSRNETFPESLPYFLAGIIGILYSIGKADTSSKENQRTKIEELKQLGQRSED